ncbi:MAG: NitT/TauT family transport system permease protein [Acidimicrobiaceae bacterium]|nr:NitT/TauT family transport system permease protein [Acidimicrobiaceae bacterium]
MAGVAQVRAFPERAVPERGARVEAWRRRVRRFVMFVLALVVLAALWEGYKWFGRSVDDHVFGWRLPARSDNGSMPHVWDILRRFGQPERRGTSHSIGATVAAGAWFTFRVAMAGFVVGVVVGMALAVVMQRFRVAERGLLPYVVLSQTVPLVALAPLVVGWGGNLTLFGVRWQLWMSVAVIAAYLAFFPVAIGGLRGLQAPGDEAVELMDSYAASWRQTLLKLRLPAAVPYLVPALKLAAASSVVGAVVAEISTGTKGGIGRLIIEYSREATSDPAKVYTAMIGAAALGLAVAGLVGMLDLIMMRHRPPVGSET